MSKIKEANIDRLYEPHEIEVCKKYCKSMPYGDIGLMIGKTERQVGALIETLGLGKRQEKKIKI